MKQSTYGNNVGMYVSSVGSRVGSRVGFNLWNVRESHVISKTAEQYFLSRVSDYIKHNTHVGKSVVGMYVVGK